MALDTVAARSKRRRLPSVDVPVTQDDELRRSIEALREHVRMYEGDSGAPKERFVTIEELEKAGLIGTKVQGNFALIDSVLGGDVAQGQQSGRGGTVIINEGGGGTGATTLEGLSDTNVGGAQAGSFLSLVNGFWTGVNPFASPTFTGTTIFQNCLRIAGIDAGYVDFCHDNTDLNISHLDTTDINILDLNVNFDSGKAVEWGDVELLIFKSVSPVADPDNLLVSLDFEDGTEGGTTTSNAGAAADPVFGVSGTIKGIAAIGGSFGAELIGAGGATPQMTIAVGGAVGTDPFNFQSGRDFSIAFRYTGLETAGAVR